MSHLCDNMIAGMAREGDLVVASNYEYVLRSRTDENRTGERRVVE